MCAPGKRLLLFLLVLGSASGLSPTPCLADEGGAVATTEPTSKPAPATPQALPLSVTATAVAPGKAAEEFVLTTDDGSVKRYTIGKGVTWSTDTKAGALESVLLSPDGGRIAVTTKEALLVLDGEKGGVLWRTTRPVAHAFDPASARLIVIERDGTILELDASSGKELAKRKSGAKRAVVRATLRADGALAVLGVADG